MKYIRHKKVAWHGENLIVPEWPYMTLVPRATFGAQQNIALNFAMTGLSTSEKIQQLPFQSRMVCMLQKGLVRMQGFYSTITVGSCLAFCNKLASFFSSTKTFPHMGVTHFHLKYFKYCKGFFPAVSERSVIFRKMLVSGKSCSNVNCYHQKLNMNFNVQLKV